MNQSQLPIPELLRKRKKKLYTFTLPKLTPQQREQAREQADKVLARVFGQDTEQKDCVCF